jgi:hypothetical protein
VAQEPISREAAELEVGLKIVDSRVVIAEIDMSVVDQGHGIVVNLHPIEEWIHATEVVLEIAVMTVAHDPDTAEMIDRQSEAIEEADLQNAVADRLYVVRDPAHENRSVVGENLHLEETLQWSVKSSSGHKSVSKKLKLTWLHKGVQQRHLRKHHILQKPSLRVAQYLLESVKYLALVKTKKMIEPELAQKIPLHDVAVVLIDLPAEIEDTGISLLPTDAAIV